MDSYTFVYEGVNLSTTPQKEVLKATISIYENDKLLGVLFPKIKESVRTGQRTAEVAIHTTLKGDIYLVLLGLRGDEATFLISIKPLILWLWAGGVLLLLGGLFRLSL